MQTRRRRLRFLVVAAAVLIALPLTYRTLLIYRWRPDTCTSSTATILPQQRRTLPRRDSLRIATWNIEGHASLVDPSHVDEIARTIISLDVDAIALQEVHRGTWQARFQDQLGALAKATGMNAAWSPSYELAGGFGNAILTRGVISQAETVLLPGVGEPRTALVATIRLDDRTLQFANTHLVAWSRISRGARLRQVECLRTILPSSALVLAGDLNATPESDEVAALYEAGFVETDRLLQPTHRLMESKIDYLLVRNVDGASGVQVHETEASDHRPLTLELEVRK